MDVNQKPQLRCLLVMNEKINMKITYNCEEQEFKHVKSLMHTTYTCEVTGFKGLHQLLCPGKKALTWKENIKGKEGTLKTGSNREGKKSLVLMPKRTNKVVTD